MPAWTSHGRRITLGSVMPAATRVSLLLECTGRRSAPPMRKGWPSGCRTAPTSGALPLKSTSEVSLDSSVIANSAVRSATPIASCPPMNR